MDYKSEVENAIKETNLITNFFLGVQKHWKLTIAILILLFGMVMFAPMDDVDDTTDAQTTELVEEVDE